MNHSPAQKDLGSRAHPNTLGDHGSPVYSNTGSNRERLSTLPSYCRRRAISPRRDARQRAGGGAARAAEHRKRLNFRPLQRWSRRRFFFKTCRDVRLVRPGKTR